MCLFRTSLSIRFGVNDFLVNLLRSNGEWCLTALLISDNITGRMKIGKRRVRPIHQCAVPMRVLREVWFEGQNNDGERAVHWGQRVL